MLSVCEGGTCTYLQQIRKTHLTTLRATNKNKRIRRTIRQFDRMLFDFLVVSPGHALQSGYTFSLRGCLKSPDSVIFHRLCFPFQLPNSWGEPWSAYRES